MANLHSWEVISWDKLKRLRGEIDWKNEDRRLYFFSKLYVLIANWRGRLPDLRQTLQREEIDWILTHCTKLAGTNEQRCMNEGKAVFDFVIRTGYQDQRDVHRASSHRPTALHQTLKNWHGEPALVRNLFRIYNRFDVNYHDDEGVTHFHVACRHALDDIVEEFLVHGQVDPNCLVSDISDPPLYLALSYGHKRIVDLLLRNGADPNLANAEGSTPLHLIAKSCNDKVELVKMLFELSYEKYHPVQVNAQDMSGETALHLSLKNKNRMLVEFLLKNDANPNLFNKKGFTPLHIACKNDCEYDFEKKVVRDKLGWTPVTLRNIECIRLGEVREMMRDKTPLLHMVCNGDRDNVDLARMLFELSNKKYHPVRVNAQDKKDNTPLHVALAHGCKNMFELLLRNGADPNLANAIRVTPLHICLGNDDLAKIFFEIIDDELQAVQVDALDKESRTPLQWAVTSLRPDMVDLLLKHGADLSNFVFPSVGDFYKYVKFPDPSISQTIESKLKVTSGILGVAESLEKGGHKLDLSDALLIMMFVARYGLFEMKVEFDECWLEDENFASESKNLMIIPSMSFYDFIRLSPEKANKRLTGADYLRFLEKHYNQKERRDRFLPEGTIIQTCAVYLGEKLVRRFIRSWALECFMELIHNRLPIMCCDMIIDNLINKDLRKICVAAKNLSS